MKPLYHLLGVATMLFVLWKLHTLGLGVDPEDVTAAPEPVAVTTLAAATSLEPVHDSDAPARPAEVADVGEPQAQKTAQPTFMGKPCQQDNCAIDLAGYRWAEERGITDPADCPDSAGEFATGCRLFAGIEQQYNL